MRQFKALAVFCGAKTGIDPKYAEAAETLAQQLAEEKITLVYGGGKVGIMGLLADAMLKNGGEVIGVMPKFLVEKEIAHTKVTKLYSVDSMHERKTLIHELVDGFILLPGGTGSLEEFFEVLTWAILGLHKKPCGILNTNGYYDALIQFLDFANSQEFIRPVHRDMIIVEPDAKILLERFKNYQAPTEIRWVKTIDQT